MTVRIRYRILRLRDNVTTKLAYKRDEYFACMRCGCVVIDRAVHAKICKPPG